MKKSVGLKKRVGVIFGGKSGEHEVSLMSATAVIEHLNAEKYDVITIGVTHSGEWKLYEGAKENIKDGSWELDAKPFDMGKLNSYIDFAFPVIHGTHGEDGTLQGLFEMLEIPYAGCGVLSSAICMDKAMAKEVLTRANIDTCDYYVVTNGEVLLIDKQTLEEEVSRISNYFDAFPIFVKPSNSGSSVGISKADDVDELRTALLDAACYDRRIIVERGINGREIETAVIGNDDLIVSAIGEIIAEKDFYDYTSKYSDDNKTKLCIPAELTKDEEHEIKVAAAKAFRALDCRGYARIDFFIEKESGRILINEINTIPGFTKFSMFPRLWQSKGMEYSVMLDRIVELGYERYNDQNKRKTIYRP